MFAILQAAGWPIWFLLLASVIAVTIIVERLLYLRRDKILPPTLLPEVIKVTHGGRIDDDVVTQLAQNSPLGEVLAAGLRNLHAPREVMKEAIEEAGYTAVVNDSEPTSPVVSGGGTARHGLRMRYLR